MLNNSIIRLKVNGIQIMIKYYNDNQGIKVIYVIRNEINIKICLIYKKGV